MNKSIRDNLTTLIMLIVCAAIGVVLVKLPFTQGLILWAKQNIYWPLLDKLKDSVLTPLFFVMIAGILIVEKLYPVVKGQKTFTAGTFHDMAWMMFGLFFEAVVVAVYVASLKGLFDAHLSFLTIEPLKKLPEAGQFILGVLLGDLLSWVQHWVKHKVPWFWEIHAVHHSQRQMSLFTDFRFHFMEYFISRSITVIPMMIFAVKVPHIVAWAVFVTWQTRFYHANIKMNFGPLRYILVTPQSHRIHHSIEPRHRDRNFGVIFSIWDWMFGTQWPNADEYPDTGIEDEDFPLEMETSLLTVLTTPVKQTLYPFLRIAKSLTKGRNEKRS